MTDVVSALQALAPNEGINPTHLSSVGIYKASQSSERVPLCYSQGIIIVVQGQKRVFFNSEVFEYNPDNYLVLTLPLAAECETIVKPDKPLISLLIDFDLTLLTELVRKFDEVGKTKSCDNLAKAKGLFVSQCTTGLSDCITRLSTTLHNKLECEVLGESLVREVIYHALSGPNAAPLFALVSHNSHLSRLERVLKHLHTHFEQQLDIEQLANMAAMSSSTFHRNFKQLTASSPIQYVKIIRLNRAKALLMDKGIKVKQAAASVGYESATQFSREFTRYFGHSPSTVSV